MINVKPDGFFFTKMLSNLFFIYLCYTNKFLCQIIPILSQYQMPLSTVMTMIILLTPCFLFFFTKPIVLLYISLGNCLFVPSITVYWVAMSFIFVTPKTQDKYLLNTLITISKVCIPKVTSDIIMSMFHDNKYLFLISCKFKISCLMTIHPLLV